ncbi:MAG: helix-turn-helix transcriptional regulator [Thermoanaerobaculia bacterium]|nr:helix-turn-helix transcriptional regulator [Thermoanaerobaculia bacterium]
MAEVTAKPEDSPNRSSRSRSDRTVRSLQGLGPGLRRLRHERSWSQRVLAEEADISPTNLSAYERERLMPSTFTLGKVLDALDRDLDDLCRAMHAARAEGGEEGLLDEKHTVVEVKLKRHGGTQEPLAEWELPGEEHVLVLSYRSKPGKADDGKNPTTG